MKNKHQLHNVEQIKYFVEQIPTSRLRLGVQPQTAWKHCVFLTIKKRSL